MSPDVIVPVSQNLHRRVVCRVTLLGHCQLSKFKNKRLLPKNVRRIVADYDIILTVPNVVWVPSLC